MDTTACISLIVAAVLLTAAVSFIASSARIRRKLNYMLDSLSDGELNFRFNSRRLLGARLNKSLNRLRDILQAETAAIREKERYYGLILDSVNTGVLVYELDSQRIVYSNKKVSELLGASASVSNLRQFSKLSPELYEVFSSVSEGDSREMAVFNESSRKRLSVEAALSQVGGRGVKIVTFNDMSTALDQAENDSWTRLVRVLTHEIMNTVTPIASLSESLQKVGGKELKAGLETIATSSRGLIRFVESYRSMTRVAPPVRKAFYVRDLAANVLELTKPYLGEAVTSFVEKADDILLYADYGQILQILINLVKNAVQSGAGHILITADINPRDEVTVSVSNDGSPISPDKWEEIFVPFYTTKSDGTGIGLSLSRQIMRLHGGTLRVTRSDSSSTEFVLLF